MKNCIFSETLNVHYTVLYNLFEQSSYFFKKKKMGWGGKRERETRERERERERERAPHFSYHYGNKRTTALVGG